MENLTSNASEISENSVNTFLTAIGMNSSNATEMDPLCELCADGDEFCHYGDHTIYVMGFLAMVVVIFGCVANALNARIFTHRFMRVSLLNWYYAALSISDLLVLITGFLRDCMPRLADFSGAYGMYSAASTLAPATQAIGCVAQTASVSLFYYLIEFRVIRKAILGFPNRGYVGASIRWSVLSVQSAQNSFEKEYANPDRFCSRIRSFIQYNARVRGQNERSEL